MLTKIKRVCDFVSSLREIQWNTASITIVGTLMALIVVVFIILLILHAENTGAIVSNSPECATVGKDVIKEGGSAVDAAIATLLCEGVALPNSAGIGGGFVALMYLNRNFESIVATPTVPAAIGSATMLNGSFLYGAKSMGVPGELKGYWEMHRKYGVLSWKRLFQPSIKLCLRGVRISRWYETLMKHSKLRLQNSKSLRYLLRVNEKEILSEEFKMKYLTLANTLVKIAEFGPDIFYNGELGDWFVKDIQEDGGIITKRDLENYRVIWNDKLDKIRVKDFFKIVTTPMPTSGAIISLILNIVKNMDTQKNPGLFWHNFIEALKYALGHLPYLGDSVSNHENAEIINRAYETLTDPEYARKIRRLIKEGETFNKFKHYGNPFVFRDEPGSGNICVVAPNGEVVVATTNLGSQFGASFGSVSTGIIVNNLLSRYVRPKKLNFEKVPILRPVPGSHLFSMHSPTIVVHGVSGDPFFVVGASGGPIAISLIATAIAKYIFNQTTTREAASAKYLNYRPYPGRVEYEEIDGSILKFLLGKGHKISQKTRQFNNISAVTCIGYRRSPPEADFSWIKGGSIAYNLPSITFHLLIVAIFAGLAAAVVFTTLWKILRP